MPSLSDRLKSLGVKVGAQDLPAPAPRAVPSLEGVLPGRVESTQAGDTYITEAFYPLEYYYGQAPLRLEASLQAIAEWAGGGSPELAARIAGCSQQQFAFLDIETTGLMGGTGTYAFLVGVGRFEADGFHLAQFFMRDPSEELAQLLALEGFLAPCDTLVTYNGKSFDVPILNTRYITQGWKPPFAPLAHVDLLQLARKVWRERLQSRSLGNVETFILGARRSQEDVPGWMIPQMYFDYLRSGDAAPLRSVFYHNEMDVLAMAALLNHLAGLLADPHSAGPELTLDLAGIARLHEDRGQLEEACRLYRRCLEGELPPELRRSLMERLSFIYKRRGDYPAAIELWEAAAALKHMYAFEELAKYYEHRARQPEEAVRWTQAGLSCVGSAGLSLFERRQWREALEHRLERVRRKCRG